MIGGESESRAKARTVLRPSVGAACAAQAVEPQRSEGIDINDLVAELADQAKAVREGSLARPEALLVAQALTLDHLFNKLLRRAMACETVPSFEVNMRMALRSQSQCARTLEVLAALKNPPVVIAKQANVTTGPQQNNVGLARGENDIKQTELLEQIDGERLDTGAASQTVAGDSALENVGAQHGT